MNPWWLIALLAAAAVRAQAEPVEQTRNLGIHLDNDAFAPADKDQDYTGGISITLTEPRLQNSWVYHDEILRKLDFFESRRPHPQGHDIISPGAEFGFSAFTPSDIKSSQPLQNDRPYASLFFWNQTRQSVALSEARPHASTVSLSVGLLGLDIIEDVQDFLHRLTDNNQPAGWANQISSGGEPTFRISWHQLYPLSAIDHGEGLKSELSGSYKLNLGYLTDASAAATLRWGNIRSPWWLFTPFSGEYAEKSAVHSGPTKSSEWYAWIGTTGRFRVYNAFLQGQFRDSAVSYSSDALRHGILEIKLGLTYRFASAWEVGYQWNGQSSDFRSGPVDRSVKWGTLFMTAPLR